MSVIINVNNNKASDLIISDEYPQDIETGNPKAESSGLLTSLKDNAKKLSKYVLNLETYHVLAEVLESTAELFDAKEITWMASEIKSGAKMAQSGQMLSEGKFVFSPSKYVNGTDKEAAEVARTYLTAVKLASIVSEHVSLGLQMTNNETASTIVDTFVTPIFKSTLGAPLKLFAGYSNIKAILSTEPKTEEEKKLKQLHTLVNAMSMALTGTKTVLDISALVPPEVAASTIFGLPMGVVALTLAVIEVYLTYKAISSESAAELPKEVVQDV